jgi:hypothetical protein
MTAAPYFHLAHSAHWLADKPLGTPRYHVWGGDPPRCIWCGHLRSAAAAAADRYRKEPPPDDNRTD